MTESFLDADAILSPWVIIALGLAAMCASLHLAWRLRERGALILAWGGLNIAAGYLWIYVTQPPFIPRAIAVRMAIIYLLVSIIYYTGRRAKLFTCIHRYITRIRERG